MFLIVGLGNPGKEHEHTRHNIGFDAVDAIISHYQLHGPQKKFQGLLYSGTTEDGNKLTVLKPQTYMNLSGQSVQAAMTFYKLPLDHIIVLHDELDLPLGTVRIKQGGGHAGHNGLRDIDAKIGKEYRRIRIGIGHPGDKNKVSSYVLQRFSKEEQLQAKEVIHYILRPLQTLLQEIPAENSHL